jgi:hypothetical protein
LWHCYRANASQHRRHAPQFIPHGDEKHPFHSISSPLEQFQEKCETVFPGKAHSAFPWELRQNKEIERLAVSVKR